MKQFCIKIADCFFLLRIPLHVPVWTILLMGWITTNPHAKPGGFLTNIALLGEEARVWIALGSFSLVVAFIYVVNQIVDVEGDRINHKLFILPNGLLSLKTAWISACICALSGILLSVFFMDSIMTLIFISSIGLGILYNLPPFRLKDRAWGGVIANFLGHGMFTYLVGWHAVSIGQSISGQGWLAGILASCSAGFANAAVFLTTTIPDVEGDRITGKRTFCIVYGLKNTALAAAISCFLALFFSRFLPVNSWVMIVQCLLSLILFLRFFISAKFENVFKTFRWPVFLLSILIILFMPLYGILLLSTLIISRIYYKLRFNYEYPSLKSQ